MMLFLKKMRFLCAGGVFALVCASIALSGCFSYRLAGTPVKLPFKTVYVKPVQNLSYAPQAADPLTNAISAAINRAPEVKTALEGDADAILDVRIVDFRRRAVATKSADTAVSAANRVTLTAKCTLVKRNGDVVFADRTVKASATVYAGDINATVTGEYQTMPVLARELGEKVKDAVIGIW